MTRERAAQGADLSRNNSTEPSGARIGYLMQNGAPDLASLSGPQLHVIAVIDGLRALGHQVRTVATQSGRLVTSDDRQHWAEPRFGVVGRRPFRLCESGLRRLQTELRLPFLGAFDSVRFADACVQHLGGFDLLYERHGYMGYGGVLAARRLGIPHVLELNGNIVREIDEMGVSMSSVQRALGRAITARTLLATDHVVVVSDALKDVLVSSFRIPSESVSVVLNGVDLGLFTAAVDEGVVREKYGIRSHPVVVFTGSFQPWHGVELLIEAFKSVRQRFPDARMLLVGDGAARGVVEDQIAAAGLRDAIRLLGHLAQSEVAGVVAVADAVVAPYPYTHGNIVGTPLKILEYMAAGKAIVASTAPIHEIVRDGVTGIRTAPADAEALASGIMRVLSDRVLAASLGANARRFARDYSWAEVVRRLCAVFARVSPKCAVAVH